MKSVIMIPLDSEFYEIKDSFFIRLSTNLYPYVHVVTWSLPKRYLGLLRIFNLPLEEYPHHFITNASNTLHSYEHQVTKKAISQPQPEIHADNLARPTNLHSQKPIENFELHQGSSGDHPPPRKKGRRPKKKSVISIRVKLDDDLRKLKNTNGKNFDKILQKCSKKSCLLVIEKSKTSKKDELSLNFVKEVGKPYSKLLRKNRRKKQLLYSCSKPNHSLSSDFSEENVHPTLQKINNAFPCQQVNNNDQNTSNTHSRCEVQTTNVPTSIDSKNVEQLEKKTEEICDEMNLKLTKVNERKKESTQLTVPSNMIPYKDPVPDEKPLRNWPIITQLFDKDNLEIYKNYLKSLASKNEHKEDDKQDKNKQRDEYVIPDLSEARAFHEGLKITSIVNNEIEVDEKSSNLKNENVYIINDVEKDESRTAFFIENPIESTKYFSVNEKNSQTQKVYTSTAYLLVDGIDSKSSDETKSSSSEQVPLNIPSSYSLVNTRLLSSCMKSYESITKNDDKCEEGYGKDFYKDPVEKARSERKIRGMRKLFFLNIVLALFVIVVLGVILFISFADTSTVNGFVEKYVRR